MFFKFKQFFALIMIISSVMIISVFVTPTYAAEGEVNLFGDDVGENIGIDALDDTGLSRRDPRIIVANIIRIFLGILGVLAVVLVMYGGFIWMNAGGSPDKIEKARKIITNAVIGLLIILSSFAIVTYITSRFLAATGGMSGGSEVSSKVPGAGIGALGNGILKSVYPAPGQSGVPRNTSIIVSFREEMNPGSICDLVVNNRCKDAHILLDSVKIFESDSDSDQAVKATVVSRDNKIFVITPVEYLGSPAVDIWYTVYLTTDIEKARGGGAFSFEGYYWEFETNGLFDFESPYILENGIFPVPDTEKDTTGAVVDAKQAVGQIVVNGTPNAYRSASVEEIEIGGQTKSFKEIDGIDNLICNDGIVEISIAQMGQANIDYSDTTLQDTIANIVSKEMSLISCGLSLSFDDYQVGDYWKLEIENKILADSLLVGNTKYTFVDSNPGYNEILISGDNNTMAGNINSALKDNNKVSPVLTGNVVKLTAKEAGLRGNNIKIASTNVSLIQTIPMAGGANKETSFNIVGSKDNPKNTVIQINFNEAINPVYISGDSNSVKEYIRVINVETNDIISGQFVISNQYKTVEFFSDFKCGVNGCGESVYCLPSDSNIKVELIAAELVATCTVDDECNNRSPYNKCVDEVCTNLNNKKHPEGRNGTGLVDLANNSLDGNRDGNTYGPVSFYNENIKDTSKGDNYNWSFWISDKLDLTPPQITVISPTEQFDIDPQADISVSFDKLMLFSSLATGEVVADSGNTPVTHKLVNLKTKSRKALGYWITAKNRETSIIPDNEPDETYINIHHSDFVEGTKYSAQVGSGVRDIYQNCFMPCASSTCYASPSAPSCCNNKPTESNTCN